MAGAVGREGQSGRAALPWVVWNRIPKPVQVPTRSLIALARRMNAHNSRLPVGPVPPLPAAAVELRTRYGGFWFDSTDEKLTPWIRRHATWEEDVLRLLRSTVRPGMTVVDVGANVGFHSVVLSRLVGAAGHVHSFEPLPVTLDILRANLWRHDCANTTLHEAAVTDRPGPVQLVLDSEGRSGAHLGAGGVVVEATTLDQALAGLSVDVLKVDVEGAEPLVLRGGRELLARSPRLTAVVEFRGYEHLDGSSPDAVLDLYEDLGLTAFLLAHDGRIVPASRDSILSAAARVDTLNIVLRPS